MKSVKNIIVLVFSVVTLTSCGGKKEQIQDKELSSFMLGGIYFLNGYGGTDNVVKMMKDADYTSDEQLVSGYKEIFQFAFEKSQGRDIKRMFKSMWDISNKKELLESINDLKTREHKYKAWDYARIINNASMGYAASWLSKDEVKQIVQEILPLAQERFENWETYYVDFNKGRIDWNANDDQAESFEKIAKNITTYENSIYKILPLHTAE
ncbi:DUF1266 domain-containing protein [uncultured Tenacibaculum sp.]|uniref:DUF1266 domain-containing protein n=1 Tax=uncultured Tenacibaculum sp. TaxID=174713 RepID=UPI0026260001|nr:DUF1266 domain-containing protein [uncultured Tenacibaculum sp.]